MNRIGRSVFFATILMSASAAAGGFGSVGPVVVKSGGTYTTTGPSPSTTPPPKGWPHTILSATSTNCARNPYPNEVIVYRDPNFRGSCAALTPGFYPHAANLLVGNDAISSIKVGSAVRARAFKNPVYGGAWNAYAPGTLSGGLGSFNDTISSMRIEPANRRQTCDDLQEGEIALFENEAGQGDCVVLSGDDSYPIAESMGIENDSISSIRNNSSRKLVAFWHPGFSLAGFHVLPHSKVDKLPKGGWFTNGINDDISSIQMQ
jgi:hypothetical protein